MNNLITHTESPTSVSSCAYDFYPASTLNESDKKSIVNWGEQLKAEYSDALTTVCLIGMASLGAMLIEAPEAPPSQINTYSHIFKLEDQITVNTVFPYGYQIINSNEVFKYLLKHPDLKSFLESGLTKFKSITGSTNLALEYEGIKEEEWENLYVIIHLDDYDEQHINDIENTLFEEWLNEVPEAIIQNLTISIS